MGVDYSRERHNVNDLAGKLVGRIDGDEYVRSGVNQLYRIDDQAVYDMSGKLIGFIDSGAVTSPDGAKLFSIEAE